MENRENTAAYALLFDIENGLRELLIEKLQSVEGAKWYKRRLPPDVLTKYQDGLRYQKAARWVTLIPHHSVYYIDFSDLRKVIERNDNWRDCFASLFARKEIFVATLAAIEPIRNSVAHNRVVSVEDVAQLEVAKNQLEAALKFSNLSALLSSPW